MITPSVFNLKFNPYNQTVHSNKILKRSKYRKFNVNISEEKLLIFA